MPPIRILQLENDAFDAELVTSTLEKNDIEFEVVLVDTREDFVAAIEGEAFDLVLADYSLPAFDGISALAIVRERFFDLPFILVSGTLGEDVAIESLKAGATDYVLKHNLSRLVPAVRRALQEAATVADRLAAENALRASEEKFRNIIDNSTNLFFTHTPDHVLTYLSPQCRYFLDCEPEEVMTLWTDAFTENPINERGREITQRAIDTGQRQEPYELELRTKTGRIIWVEVFEAPVVQDGKTVAVVGALADITERRKSEQALRESEEKYRDLVEKAGVAIVVYDEDGRLRYFNEPFMEIFGFSDEELRQRKIWDLIHPDDLASVRDQHASRFSDDLEADASYSFRGVRKDRETIHLEINTTTQVEDGRVIGSSSFIRDVTDRKRLEEQLVQAQKLEALGQLAGGIAHDFNNLLMSISGSAELLGFRYSVGGAEMQELVTIRDTVERAATLTRRLLAIARQQVLEIEALDLSTVVGDEIEILRRLIPESIEIDLRLAEHLPIVAADRGQLGQVLMNLMVNARDAMPDGGVITVTTRDTVAEDDTMLNQPGVRAGVYVSLSVDDTGVGMDALTLAHIFEPFLTTKADAEGTGMGLATVYGIVKQHEGVIRVESALGEGTKFEVYLPVATGTVDKKTSSGEREAVSGDETVLVVEDEAGVRAAVVGMLDALGYTVVEAADGKEALELLEGGTAVDLVISDVVMPKVGGRALLEGTRKRAPRLPCLFSSGYTDETLRDLLEIDERSSFIAKPFTMKRLSRAVRQALGGKG